MLKTKNLTNLLGAMLKNGGRISEELLHVTDWLPTLVVAAGKFSLTKNHLGNFYKTLTLQRFCV
jgi:arylsulfatase A-like enzyme